MKGFRVPKRLAESVRRQLSRQGELREGYKPIRDDDSVIFPVVEDASESHGDWSFEPYDDTPTFEEAVKDILSDEEQESFIGAYDVIGDIALIQVSDELEHKAEAIAERLLESRNGLRSVRRRNTPRRGDYRLRRTEHLAGEVKTETVHREHGVSLRVDVDDVYFSPRLSEERRRVAAQVQGGESVLVMFSGCAPYPCVIASLTDAERVVGVEWNESGHQLALQNVEANDLEGCVDVLQGDVSDVVPGLGRFDRVVMPAPHSALDYLDVAEQALCRTGFLHVYSFTEDRGETRDEICGALGSGFEVEQCVNCGDRGPAVERVCFDISRTS